MNRNVSTSAAVAALLFATLAQAGPTAEQKCEGGKNQAAGKYAACIAKAEKGLVTKDDATKYGEALVKCEEKLTKSWDKLELKATDAGTACPSEADRTPVEEFLDACGQSVAAALAGGTLGPDPVACDADLTTCEGDLSSTNADLGTCNADFGACDASLSSTNADLGTCNDNLSTTLAAVNAGTATAANVVLGQTFSSGAGLGLTGTLVYPPAACQATTGGYCWFKGAPGQNCNEACAAAGRPYDVATALYGSAGTDGDCIALAAAFGDVNFAGTHTRGGTGCANTAGTFFRRDTDPTIAGASLVSGRRYCACELL